MRKIIFVGVFLLVAFVGQCQKKVLFVGNSYTQVNNLPQMVSQVAASMGDEIEYQSNTPGGCTFAQHCGNQSMNLIRQGDWDVVVLQEQSQYPSFPPSQVANEVFPYAARLVDSVYANSPCAEPMFYMTWGRKNGDAMNAASYPVLGTYEGMDSLLYERYLYMAQANDASVCPVGRVWRYLRENAPDIELYQSDESHPSLAGTYAAACAFYVMLFHQNPVLIGYRPDINPDHASLIRLAVKAVVYDQLPFWQRPKPSAQFSATAQENGQILFSNASQNADTYLWSFGDGTASIEANPFHSYAQEGSYLVTLVASRHCMADTVARTIAVEAVEPPIDTTGISAPCVTASLYPNPAHESATLECSHSGKADIHAADGRKICSLPVHPGANALPLQGLRKGCYFLRLSGEMGSSFLRLIIQ